MATMRRAATLARPSAARRQAALLFLCLAVVSAYLFLLYGARLFTLLRRFPIDSRGRRSKLREIGSITGIACSCFPGAGVSPG